MREETGGVLHLVCPVLSYLLGSLLVAQRAVWDAHEELAVLLGGVRGMAALAWSTPSDLEAKEHAHLLLSR
jgi:hypothetical protein